jgi:TRAP-type transport system periplasmic protein
MKKTLFMLAACAAVSTMGTSSARAEMTLKLSHFAPTSVGLHNEFMEPWARDLEACTNGDVKVEIHAAGSALGSIVKQYDQVRAGVTDIAFGHAGIPRGRFPRTTLIGLPFLTKSSNANSFALWNLSSTLLKPDYPGVRVLGLMAHSSGLLHASKPLTQITDIKGMRIRTPDPMVSAVMKAYGADPIGMPPGQTYENMQKGTINGVASDWTGVGAFKLAEVTTHHLQLPLFTVGFYFVMNERKYNALPGNVRTCVDKLSGDNLVPKFGPWWASWDQRGYAQAVKAGNVITVVSPQEVQTIKEQISPITNGFIEEAKAAGVKNAAEIVAAFEKELQKYD